MTRILYWNIEKFSSNTINAAGPTPLLAQMATDRFNLIGSIINPGGGAPPPDIFVVVEVSAHTDPVIPEGLTLYPGSSGGEAVRLMLQAIRNAHGANWALVPPLFLGRMGYREGVAVFYNSARLMFAGPYVWCQPHPADITLARPGEGLNLHKLQNYVPEWAGCLPGGGRTWEYEGVKVPEVQSAGQWEFYAGGSRIYFPGWDNRSPFYTRFIDLAGGGRVLKLFSVHTSPATSGQAVERLAWIPQLAPAANEVSLVVGDFNVDTFGGEAAAYNGLIGGGGFKLLLDSHDETGVVNGNRKPYCMTHMLPLQHATSWNASAGVAVNRNVYPRFGYMGSVIPGGALSDAGAIDNALVRYGTPGPVPKASVVNPVVGTPYNQLWPPPAGVNAELTNGAPYPTSMAAPLPLPGGVNPPFDTTDFLAWNNYGKIRSTSDHLPLIIDV